VKVGDCTGVQEEKDPLLIREVSFEAVIFVCVCVRACLPPHKRKSKVRPISFTCP
jgi:hypothetical protein